MENIDALRGAAHAIAEDVVRNARTGDATAHWITAAFSLASHQPIWRAGADLYNGSAGLALFLIEAALPLQSSAYFDLGVAGLSWCEQNAGREYSFYSGRFGIAYAYLRAYDISGRDEYIERALRLADGYERHIENFTCMDLLNGLAGVVIGLLHLHEHTGEEWLLRGAYLGLERIAQTARWTREGLCWDIRSDYIRGLCGMSHGSSGIAFAMLEAASYLNQPAYAGVALEAIRYENSLYDEQQQSWPDFRKLKRLPGPELEEEYASATNEFLLSPVFMDAWCHGAPGIALCRLRALELEGERWLGDVRRAIRRTEQITPAQRTLTLCHGACGNAVVFLEAERILSDPSFRASAEQVALRAAEARRLGQPLISGYSPLGEQEDLSLMMGNAGIGYFLLQVTDAVPNLLLPRLGQRQKAPACRVAEGDIVRRLASSLMPRTVAAIERNAPSALQGIAEGGMNRDDLVAKITAAASDVGATDDASLERAVIEMRDECPSFALVKVLTWRAQQALVAISDDEILRLPLQLAPFTDIWFGDSDVPPRLLRIDDIDVTTSPLTPFAAAVLELFKSPITVDTAIAQMLEQFEERPSSISRLSESVRAQVLEAWKSGIVVPHRGGPGTDPPRGTEFSATAAG